MTLDQTVAIVSENRKVSGAVQLYFSAGMADKEGVLKDILAVSALAAVKCATELLLKNGIEGVVVASG